MGSEVIEAQLKELREKLRDYGNSVEEMARHCFYAGKNLEAGDISTKRILRDLASHCSAARLKYPEGHTNTMTTRGVLAAEMYELDDAMHRRATREVRAELLDIATTCIRGVESMDRTSAAEAVPS